MKMVKRKELNQSMWASFKSQEGIVHLDIKLINAISEYKEQIVLHTPSRDFEVPANKFNLRELKRVMQANQNYLIQV